MTREEALKQLRELADYFQDRIEKETDIRFDKEEAKKDVEALKMAIRALKSSDILIPKYRDGEQDEYNRGFNDCLEEVIDTIDKYLKEIQV